MNGLNQIKKKIARKVKPLIDLKRSRTPFFERFPAEGTTSLVNSRTLIDLQRRYVYSRIPKAANSTVVATLYLEAKEGEPADSVEHLKKGDIRPDKLSAQQVEEVVNSFAKFTFVRNPYLRIVSCYLDKFTRPHPVGEKARAAMGMPFGAEVSFACFLDFISTDRGRRMDAHWARQTELMAFPVETYNFIGAVETIDADLPELLIMLGISRPVTRFSPHRTRSSELLSTIANSELRRIYEIYAPDFEDLGYDQNPSNPIRIGRRAL